MGIDNIMKREHEIVAYIFSELGAVSNIKILAGQHQDRLVLFRSMWMICTLGVKLLNDKWNTNSRRCSCAGTYTFVTRRPRNVP
jgi:selenocysteine lyase/cysteine desulfurase